MGELDWSSSPWCVPTPFVVKDQLVRVSLLHRRSTLKEADTQTRVL